MMAVLKGFQLEMKFTDNPFHTLVIENKKLYRDVLYGMESDTPEDHFVFSKNYEPFAFEKKGMYIANPINPELNNKKLLAKVNSFLENMANTELYSQLSELKSRLVLFAEQLAVQSDFALEYSPDVDTKSVIKLFDFRIEKCEDDFSQLFIRYVLLLREYLGISLFTVSGLHAFFEKEELELIYKTLNLNEVALLCIEHTVTDNLTHYEQVHIVDRDLCELT